MFLLSIKAFRLFFISIFNYLFKTYLYIVAFLIKFKYIYLKYFKINISAFLVLMVLT